MVQPARVQRGGAEHQPVGAARRVDQHLVRVALDQHGRDADVDVDLATGPGDDGDLGPQRGPSRGVPGLPGECRHRSRP